MKLREEAVKKASLLETGLIHISERGLLALTERPTAGPDAGLRGIFIKFGRYRVRLAVTKNSNEVPFKLKRVNDEYIVLRRDSTFIRNVIVEKPILHTPNQAFINLASSCIFDCKFCATPKLNVKFILEPRRVLNLIKSAMGSGDRIEAIALTSGVVGSEKKTVKLMIDTVKLIRGEIGHQIPIGVEPYVTEKDYIDELYSSGADELKVNVESLDTSIMMTVCPDIDYEKVLSALEYSTSVFGRNKVCSNVIIGLGESDDCVTNGLKWMSELGVVANLKPILLNSHRRQDIIQATQNKVARPSATRMLKLALSHKSILEKNKLKTSEFQTMCFKCTGCEIVPQKDV